MNHTPNAEQQPASDKNAKQHEKWNIGFCAFLHRSFECFFVDERFAYKLNVHNVCCEWVENGEYQLRHSDSIHDVG